MTNGAVVPDGNISSIQCDIPIVKNKINVLEITPVFKKVPMPCRFYPRGEVNEGMLKGG